MKHIYYGIWDRAALKYVHISESVNDATMKRMCEVLAKDEKTFIGQKPDDFRCDKLATFDDENGAFDNILPVKIWEGRPE